MNHRLTRKELAKKLRREQRQFIISLREVSR